MRKILLTLFIIPSIFSFSQEDIKYKPVLNTNINVAFPNAAAIMKVHFKTGIEKFDYVGRAINTTWHEYYRGLSRFRCKFLFSIDDNNTLDVKTIDIQRWDSSISSWVSSGEGLFSKKEEQYRAIIAESIRAMIKNEEVTRENQNWFFKNLDITTLFFEHATDLAGDRWFNLYLKNQEVKWTLTFVDVEKSEKGNYKYKEIFVHTTTQAITSINDKVSKFIIIKYTNNDGNVLTRKGDMKEVSGYCRLLEYDKGNFYIKLTDSLDDVMPSNIIPIENDEDSEKSVLDVADKLKKLKELLDMGLITEEEFKIEKQKILDNM